MAILKRRHVPIRALLADNRTWLDVILEELKLFQECELQACQVKVIYEEVVEVSRDR